MKVIVKSAGPIDATSLYRCWGVIPDIERRTNIKFTSYEETLMTVNIEGQHKRIFSWAVGGRHDVFFAQRLLTEQDLALLTYAKELGMKIVYELDDNFWEIPDSFRIKSYFPNQILKNIDGMLEVADIIIVSTKALQNYLSAKGFKSFVVNNGIDLEKWPIQSYNESGPTIWRGSETHIEDLRKFRTEIESYQGIQFWGYNPIKERPLLQVKGTYVPPLDPIHYFQALRAVKPNILVTPLVEDTFNECKSNIAYLEATMAGAVCVSNQWGEFAGKGIPFRQEPNKYDHAVAWQDVIDNYDLRRLNNLRIGLLEGLFGG